MKKPILLSLMSLLFLTGCIKIGTAGHGFNVVKFKNDYDNNAFAMNEKQNYPLGSGENYIILPSFTSGKFPIKLTNSYYIFRDMYKSLVVLSITPEEGATGNYSSDSIKSLIIDDDPIVDWWFRDEQGRRRFSIDCWDSDCCPYDTAALNEVIVSGKLKRYFERLK